MTRSADEIARTITPDSRLLVWKRQGHATMAIIAPDLRVAGTLSEALPGEVEVAELMSIETMTELLTAARRMTEAQHNLSRAETDAQNREKELRRTVLGLDKSNA